MKIGEIMDTGGGDALHGVLEFEVGHGSTISMTGVVGKVVMVEIVSVEIGAEVNGRDTSRQTMTYALNVTEATKLAARIVQMVRAATDA